MQFLYPGFLWALTALSIPIILHLFYFRRYKKVYFSNLRFLREVKEETSARNRLRNLLILLSRLLAMAFLILAFAQPYLPVRKDVKAGLRDVSIFVDNSFSMQSFGKDLSLFDKSRQKAREIILGYNAEDRFSLLSHELSAAQMQWISRDEALTRLEELELTPEVKPLSVAVNRMKQMQSGSNGTPVAWIISDFQQSINDLTPADSTLELNLVPMLGVQEKNVSIDSAWFESPVQTLNQTSVLLFTLRNYAADASDNIRVTIGLDGQERPEGSVDIGGHQAVTDTSKITVLKSGWHDVAIRISDFPVTFDDTYFLSFYVAEYLHILSIHEQQANQKIEAVFADKENFIFDQALANNLEYSAFPQYNLIILSELTRMPSGLISALKRYADEGGKVLLIPSARGTPDQYNALLQAFGAGPMTAWQDQERQAGTINTDAFVYKDVFSRTRPNMRLPRVTGSFGLSNTGRKGQSLLTFRDGGDFVTFYTTGKGALCVISSPLDESINNLTQQPEIFVPLLYKLAIYTAQNRRLAFTIGTDHLVPLEKNEVNLDQELSITGPSTFKPGLSPLGSLLLMDVQGQINTSGFYKVIQQDKAIASLAFNYDRKESDLTMTPAADLPSNSMIRVWSENEEKDFTQLIESTQHGRPLWKWCIILSLIFIGMEIALIRLWKNT